MKKTMVVVPARNRCAAEGAKDRIFTQQTKEDDAAALPSQSNDETRSSPYDSETSDVVNEGDTADESTRFGVNAMWSDTVSVRSDNVGIDSSCSTPEGDRGGGGGGSRRPQKNNLGRYRRTTEDLHKTGCRDEARARGKRQGHRVRVLRTNTNEIVDGSTNIVEETRREGTGRVLQSFRGRPDETVLSETRDSDSRDGLEASLSLAEDSETATSLSGDDGENDSDDGVDASDPLEPIPGEVKLVPSMFPDRPPTVFFEYPKELGMVRFDNDFVTEPLGGRKLLFKTHWERNSVKNAFYRAGFSRTTSTLSWTASWGKHPTREGFKNLNRFQKVNHFPGSWCIGRKDRLLRTLARHKREISGVASVAAAAAAATTTVTVTLAPVVAGRCSKRSRDKSGGTEASGFETASSVNHLIDITPDGFVLPVDRGAWLKTIEAEPKAIWIVKPPASSCGRGIRVIGKATAGKVSNSKKCVVQRYIHNPMLIDGRKFDLRLYVLVTSTEPLRVYLFEEGLVRLSTKKYSLKNLRSRYTHLTNFSINRKSYYFQTPDDSNGLEVTESTSASKWALTFFWKYLEETLGKKKSDEVRRSIDDVVLRTMAAADGDMTTHAHEVSRHRGCCYELFGFDVLLDEHLKPWLLEVNISPSLFGSSALDRRIKGTLMADIFHLVGFRPFDRMAMRREERKEARHLPGTKKAVRAVVGKPQDAWRRCQIPASIKLSELREDEWEVIRDTEDEQHRVGHFRVLYPTAENVIRMRLVFRTPRFLNGVLARWFLTGGLSNASNRTDIGLTIERLASLDNNFRRLENASASGSASSAGKQKGKGSRLRRESGDDGRWEETTSNATTIVYAGGARLGPIDFLGGSPRSTSSATSRASRPLGQGAIMQTKNTVACAVARIGGGGQSTQHYLDKRVGGRVHGGKGIDNVPGVLSCKGRGVVKLRGLAGRERSSEVPLLKLHSTERKAIVGQSLLAVKPPILSARTIASGKCRDGESLRGSSNALCGDDKRLALVPRARRVPSASRSRSNIGQSKKEEEGRGGDGCATLVGIGGRLALNSLRGSSFVLLSEAVKARQTVKKWSPHVVLLPGRDQERATVRRTDHRLRFHGSGTIKAISLANLALANSFPQFSSCQEGRHATDKVGGNAYPSHAFATGLLPTTCSRFTTKNDTSASHALLSASLKYCDSSNACDGGITESKGSHHTVFPRDSLGGPFAVKVAGVESTCSALCGTPGREARINGQHATMHRLHRADEKVGTTERPTPRFEPPPPLPLLGTRDFPTVANVEPPPSMNFHQFRTLGLDKVKFMPRFDEFFNESSDFQQQLQPRLN